MPEEPEIRRAAYAEKKGEIVLREHEYDGIQEYDQKLPNWWLFIFIGAHIFFLGYWITYYQFGWFQTDEQRIERAMAVISEVKKKALDDMLAKLTDEAIINDWATDPTRVATGESIYMSNCIACHGQDLAAKIDLGGGQSVNLPGLPLTDGEWKYGDKPMDIFKLINEGTPADSPGHNGAKMEAWGQKLPPVQIAELTAFLVSKNPDDFQQK
ncbi:cbb3-type cytochrome c oxidase N-terminal domain-containing protein [Luteolibacter sp. AS25]|uniref:cbb3-type cytochrome c oxidase N-terminal domain-containing protein n=1 Tax=Luteolibacter sp. AS25 TaxID=3135776 RepID=UPI00398A8ED0